MKLRTELPHNPLQKPMDCNDSILLLGSCFTEHIGQWLQSSWLDVCCNPWGVLFNPASIAQSLGRCMDSLPYQPDFCRQGTQVCSFDHHSSISAASEEELRKRILDIDQQTRSFLTSVNHLFITWGTAWVYERQGRIVANCHKAPASEFTRRRLTVQEIVKLWSPIVEQWHTVITVSPIRHIGDGLHGNQLSKATLLLAIEELQRLYPSQVEYLPVYELLIDDLRDYRFYADDLVHPAPLAIEAVRELTAQCACTPMLQSYLKEADTLIRTLNHRPSDPNAPDYQAMIQRTQEKKDLLMKKYNRHISKNIL